MISKLKTAIRLHQILTLIIASFLVLVHVRLYQYAFDDAFIHFRVARNLFETGQPYFNPGNLLKVSTSSGWIVFLTVLFGMANLFGTENNFPLLVSIVNAFILLGGLIVYTNIVETLLKRGLPTFERILFQITFLAILLPSSIGLMETPLALLVAGLGIRMLLRSKPAGFALLGFSIYLRLELILLLALIGLFVLVQKQFRVGQIIAYSALGAFPLFFYDLYYFHTFVPHAIVAKSNVYSITTLDALIQLFNALPITLDHNKPIYLVISSITLLSIVLLTSWVAFRERKILKSFWPLLFCLLGLAVIAGYIFGHALVFDWYAPLFMLPILLACCVCSFLIEPPRNIIVKLPLFFLFCLSVLVIGGTFYASFYDPATFILFEGGSRVKRYLQVGRILNEEYPKASLLSSEIGALGYSFKGEILDAVGLASSGALDYHPMKVPDERTSGLLGAIPPAYVRSIMPDIIVSYDLFAQALLNDDIVDRYNAIVIPAYLPEDEIYSASKTIWGSRYIRVYIRKTLPVSDRIYALTK